jgi:hypothetical protein
MVPFAGFRRQASAGNFYPSAGTHKSLHGSLASFSVIWEIAPKTVWSLLEKTWAFAVMVGFKYNETGHAGMEQPW